MVKTCTNIEMAIPSLVLFVQLAVERLLDSARSRQGTGSFFCLPEIFKIMFDSSQLHFDSQDICQTCSEVLGENRTLDDEKKFCSDICHLRYWKSKLSHLGDSFMNHKEIDSLSLLGGSERAASYKELSARIYDVFDPIKRPFLFIAPPESKSNQSLLQPPVVAGEVPRRGTRGYLSIIFAIIGTPPALFLSALLAIWLIKDEEELSKIGLAIMVGQVLLKLFNA